MSAGAKSTEPRGYAEHRVRVLLVDDQAMVGEAVRRMLADESEIDFEYCADPRDALATAKTFGPTVILMDLVMPDISGLELLEIFRADGQAGNVPIIVLSTKEEAQVKAEAFGKGAADYMVKFPDKLELLARVRYHAQGYISRLQRDEAYGALQKSQKLIRATFGRYLSDEIVDSILEAPDAVSGEKRSLTIMMADLRGFTALSESLPAETVVAVLNNYLGTMTDILQKYGGTIDEFLGDAILAIFGAPVHFDDHADRAVACSLEMQRAMVDVNEWNKKHVLPPVEMGIGLNTGEVVVGSIGSLKRAKYGVVGHHVNLAARVESYTVGGQVLVSSSTLETVEAELDIEGETFVQPKGVRDPLAIYEVTGIGPPYALTLEREPETLVAPAEPLQVKFQVLEGKDTLGGLRHGRLVRLSERQAELLSDEVVEPMSNLRMRLLDDTTKSDFYAKVLPRRAETEAACLLRFTSMPESVAVRIHAAAPEIARAARKE